MIAPANGDHLTPVVHRRVFNCFLLKEEGEGLTLIDTGPAGAVGQILDLAARTGGEIRRIVLTHAHGDHVAGLDRLVSGLGDGVEVVVGRREAPLLAGDFSMRLGEPAGSPKRRSYLTPSTQPTRLVDDGDRICSLQVIDTPGHTPGHISLIDRRDGTLIAGDAMTTLGRPAVSGDLVWRWPFPAISTWSKDLARASARRLRDELPTRIACGHGPVVGDAAAVLARAIARAG